MNGKENFNLNKIAKHVEILNHELGNVQVDIRWLKKIVGYLAAVVSIEIGRASCRERV